MDESHFEGVATGADFRLAALALIRRLNLPHARAMFLYQLQAVKDIRQLLIAADGKSHQHIFQHNSLNKTTNGDKFNAV